ncbi:MULTISPECIES: crossover junction endodeoxyribonuclease RuvC [Cryobacterium]|uniref:Holliday junction nuclease RuvC n=1 Tax=Cryobacterium breve TaxID=1259258 RepID=A0ABY2J4C3_9MICO|nr:MULTISPECIES: crossover junction endodeoxyribonuclease RuvC [Cryobacterium]TFC92072.1 hypothetical protein E3T20_12215 [Cryobacterium sp. TmT3-12]TFC99789.1 hypothetical protein E3O65_05290 [Cryobacterium breve]
MSALGSIDGLTAAIHAAPERRDWVIGLDLSLTGTGWAIYGTDGFRTGLIKSTGKKGTSLLERWCRLYDITVQIMEVVPRGALVVIEQPAYSQTGGSHHDRSGLWWMVVQDAMQARHNVVEVTPGGLKKYATGKGNASKDQVLASVVKRYANADVTDNNVADAVVLAAMGARSLGVITEAALPVLNRAAMDAVRWAA